MNALRLQLKQIQFDIKKLLKLQIPRSIRSFLTVYILHFKFQKRYPKALFEDFFTAKQRPRFRQRFEAIMPLLLPILELSVGIEISTLLPLECSVLPKSVVRMTSLPGLQITISITLSSKQCQTISMALE